VRAVGECPGFGVRVEVPKCCSWRKGVCMVVRILEEASECFINVLQVGLPNLSILVKDF
jgi:hypothetical protein